jgi:hypothetical protein
LGVCADYSLRGRGPGFGGLTSFTVCRLNDLRHAARSTAFARSAAMRALHAPLRILTSALLTTALAGACTGSPSSPSSSAIPPERLVEGLAVNAVDGSGAAGLSVRVSTAPAATTDASGYFRTAVDKPGSHSTTITGPGIVERQTIVTSPTTERARLSVIPASFDIAAFNEMFRSANARLQRWTTRPALVVIASVMAYRVPADEYTATDERMSDDEVAQLVAHLTGGLSLLTGGTYTSFARVDVERPASGTRALVTRAGTIVVGRYNGILTFAQTIGYGRWAENPDGSVNGGAMFLDWNFDRDDARRRLLRIHELGHALGYLHVESRTSIMNPAIGPEPTDFDRAAAIVAFQRQPGNVSPDTDPMSGPPNPFAPTAAHWTGPVR